LFLTFSATSLTLRNAFRLTEINIIAYSSMLRSMVLSVPKKQGLSPQKKEKPVAKTGSIWIL